MITDSSYLSRLFGQQKKTPLGYDTLFETDALVERIVTLYPDEAYATGVKINSKSEDFYNRALNSLGMWELFKKASIWSRLNGLCVMLIGATGDPLKPLKNESVEFLQIYHLDNRTDISKDVIQLGNQKYHRDRLLFFKGKEILINYGGPIKSEFSSVLDGCIEVLDKYRQIPEILLLLVKTSNQVALGTEGLGAGIRQDIITNQTTQRDYILSRLNALNDGRSVANILLYDKTNEVLTNTALNLSGVAEQIHGLENQLAIRTDYPKKVLFQDTGTTSNGLGSGEVSQLVERMVWASKVSRWIDNNWTDNIERLCEQLRRSLSLDKFDVTVPLSFILSPDEKATINKTQAEILNTLVTLYPMETQGIKDYIDNNFEDLWLPDEAVTLEPKTPIIGTDQQTDSITDDLSDLTVINDRTLDIVMTKIGEQSK